MMADVASMSVASMSFEEALRELEQVVAKLESAEVPLEESITLYSRGTELRAHCEAKLRAAEERVAEISKGADGVVRARPVEISG